MKELHYVALGLCISYLGVDEIVALLNTSKSLSFLRDSVQELTLNKNMSDDSQCLLRLGSLFSNITNLELQCISSYNLNFQSFQKLSKLSVNCRQCATLHRPRIFDDAVNLKTLIMRNVMAPCVANAFLFVQRFHRLTSLTLDRCLPILAAEVQQLVTQLPRLEELHLARCFTDRNHLVLKSAPTLRVLTLVNCPNIVGVYLHDSPALTLCEISNCPVSAKCIESIVSCSPNLHTLRVEKCSWLRQVLSVKHNRLRTLLLRGCDNITDLKVHSPRLQTLDVQLCSALITCTVRSEYLRSLDLSQLSALCTLYLDCPQLSRLDVLGCENLGNRDNRRTLDLHLYAKESLTGRLARVELHSDSEISDSDSVSSSSDASHHSAPRNTHVLAQPIVQFAPTAQSSAEDAMVSENEAPGAELVRELGLHSPLLDLRQFVSQGTRATPLHAQKEHLLGLVAEFCADADSFLGVARTTPVNSPARVKKGSPRSEVKVKKPNRRSGKRRASA